jgi:hypothetical protein
MSYRNRLRFENGYTASIVSSPISFGGNHGLFEVAVMVEDTIVYDTPITDDVIGFCTFADVARILLAIEALPPRMKTIQATPEDVRGLPTLKE